MKINISRLHFVLAIFYLYVASCAEYSTAPEYKITSGLTGRIVDTLGNPIKDAEIFCLFYLSSVPGELEKMESTFLNLDSTVFSFSLHHNFPNPFSNSTFVRFELPQQCTVRLKITNITNSLTYYNYDDILNTGFYQKYIENLVESKKLKNGFYSCSLSAVGDDGTSYSESHQSFVISNLGSPNAISKEDGTYILDYKDAFVGEQVLSNPYGLPELIEQYILTNMVNFLVQKEGYIPEIITTTLYTDILITQDIILKEKL